MSDLEEMKQRLMAKRRRLNEGDEDDRTLSDSQQALIEDASRIGRKLHEVGQALDAVTSLASHNRKTDSVRTILIDTCADLNEYLLGRIAALRVYRAAEAEEDDAIESVCTQDD